MKKLLATAAIFALAACGGKADEQVADDQVIPTTQSTFAAATEAGTYTGTDEAGQPWTSTLNADGTFEDRADGKVIRTGTWENTAEGTCFTDEAALGEAAEPQCYQMGVPDSNGTLVVTGPDGATFQMKKRM